MRRACAFAAGDVNGGEFTPPTLTAALDAGDDAAAAWEQVKQLGATVQQQHVELRRLRTRLDRSEHDASRSQHRLASGLAPSRQRHAPRELAEARHQLDDLRRLIQLDDHQTGIRITPVEDDMASDVPAGNRADRRRARRTDAASATGRPDLTTHPTNTHDHTPQQREPHTADRSVPSSV